MDPFGEGRFDNNGGPVYEDYGRRQQYFGYGRFNGDNGNGYMPRYHYDNRGNGGGAFGWDRRSRRKFKSWMIVFVIAIFGGCLAYWKFYSNLDVKGKISETMFETILEEVVGNHNNNNNSKHVTKPEMMVPPEVKMKPATDANGQSIQPQEKDQPPALHHMGMPDDKADFVHEGHHLQTQEKVAEALAVQLVATINDEDQKKAEPLVSKNPVIEDNSTFKQLTGQLEMLTSQLTKQSLLVDTLQKRLDRPVVFEGSTSSNVSAEQLAKLERQIENNNNPFVTTGKVATQAKADDESSSKPIPFLRPTIFAAAPESTVVCTGNSSVDRVCKFKHLCFDPKKDTFFVFKSSQQLEVNVPRNRSYLVDTTSIDGHNKFYFDYTEVHPNLYANTFINVVDKLTFMISRFHALNIMHTIHDDFLGLYGLHRMFAPNSDLDERFPFSQDNHILFLEGYENTRYDYIFQFITSNPLQFRKKLVRENKENPICFKDAIVGNSKIASWYSYGFLEPQGPIANKTVSGSYIRDVARFLMNKMSLPNWEESSIRVSMQELYLRKMSQDLSKKKQTNQQLILNEKTFITIFSRQLDRLIVNEAELVKGLEETYGMPVKIVRMEDMHLGQQVAILRSTAIAIGIHGSALILSMFLPPGAILVELFPYAVPAENYTPYKTLCKLPGMRLAYRSWTNKKMENNFVHPERPASGGGIKHLPLAEQEKIKNTLTVPAHTCCSNPYWLFRIYQDTKVELEEIYTAINDALKESLDLLDQDPMASIIIRPGAIDTIRCSASLPSGMDINKMTNDTLLNLQIQWDEPWNGVIPEKYGIWMHQPYKEYFSNKPSLVIPDCKNGARFDFWVRSYLTIPGQVDPIKSQYSEKHTCYCTPNTNAKKTAPNDF